MGASHHTAISANGTRGARITETNTVLVPDNADWGPDNTFNNNQNVPKIQLPETSTDSNPWKGKFSNLEVIKKEGRYTYYYKYYVIEKMQ